MRQRIFLADIDALMHERGDWKVRDGNLPEFPPSCVVHYEDLCLEKTIIGHDVGLVLQAMMSVVNSGHQIVTQLVVVRKTGARKRPGKD